MIRLFDPQAITEATDDVLGIDPQVDPEPAVYAARTEEGDPHTICLQRTRLEDLTKAIGGTGQVLVEARIPYEQLPVASIACEEKRIARLEIELPDGTCEEDILEAEEPTKLPDLGAEHEAFNDAFLDFFKSVPVADEDESEDAMRCLTFDGEVATFYARVELDQSFDPCEPVPASMRKPLL